MFVAMGLSAVFPVLHGLKVYGIEKMNDQIGLTWLVGQGVLYILGAGIYAVSQGLLTSYTAGKKFHTHRGSRLESLNDGGQGNLMFGEVPIKSFMFWSYLQQAFI